MQLEIKDWMAVPADKVEITPNQSSDEWEVKPFLRKLLRSLRQSAKQEDERGLRELAATINASEDACEEGLRVLAESGILSFKIHDGKVKIDLNALPQKVKLNTDRLKLKLERDKSLRERKLQAEKKTPELIELTR